MVQLKIIVYVIGIGTMEFSDCPSRRHNLGLLLRSRIQSCCGRTCVHCVVKTDVRIVPAWSVRFLW